MGSFSMALGLLIFGYKVLITLGKKVIILDYPKGFCTQFAASNAIMICQFMGIPVSSTHCNVGAIMGLALAAKFDVVNKVYHESKVKKENRLDKKLMLRIVLWWLMTVPLVLTASSALTSVLL